MAKPKTKRDSNFTFSTTVAKMAKPRDLSSEISGNFRTQEEVVDIIEKQAGIKPASTRAVPTVSKSKLLEPHLPADARQLELLLNSPKHKITYWKDNWSKTGVYQVFVIYTEQVEEEKNGHQ